MPANFQHPPGAEARSFIASREDDLDRTRPDHEMAATGSRDTSGQGLHFQKLKAQYPVQHCGCCPWQRL